MDKRSISHRRMGKTSILRNIATRLGADTRLAYLTLTLTDELAKVTSIPKLSDTDLLTLPEITFRRYVSAIANTNQKLIIILDEFETLETLIETGKIEPSFLAYLRGLIQLSPTMVYDRPEIIAFAFAGLDTLEEMTADYFSPPSSPASSASASASSTASSTEPPPANSSPTPTPTTP